MRLGPTLVLYALLLPACATPSRREGGALAHPGLLDSAAELEVLRERVLAGEEPWASGFSAIQDFRAHAPAPVARYRDGAGHTDDVYDVNMQQLVADAEAAYGSALRWSATRDEAYARKAVEILDAWSGTLREIDTRDDGPLSTAYGWPAMIYAAEIVRHGYDGWPAAEQARFEALLRDVVWPATQKAVDKDNGNNWKSLGLFCRLAIAVFLDDRPEFERQVAEVREQIEWYIYPDGQTLETPRDLWHAQMGMAPLVASAEIAWHQGVDLYSHAGNRLLAGVEWHIPFLLGDTAGWPQVFTSAEKKYRGYPAPGERAELWPFYELVHHHYHDRRGLLTPNTDRLLRLPGYRPERFERTGGWGTATHVGPQRPG